MRLGAVSTVIEWAAGLVRPTLLEVRCISLRAGKWLALTSQVLGSADETRISFVVRWPRAFFAFHRAVHVELTALLVPGQGPQVASIGSSEQRFARAVPKNIEDYEVRQSSTGRLTRVQVLFRVPFLRSCEAMELTIRSGRRRGLVGRHHFAVIEEARAQWLRLDTLKAEAPQLWIQGGAQCYPGRLVPDTSDSITAQFTIPNSELSQLLPACQTSITWTLHTGRKRVVLGTKPLWLGAAPVSVKTDPVPVRDKNLFPAPGPYSLVATVAGRELNAHSFQILTRQEWLQQLEVQQINLVTEMADGQIKVEQSRALRWGVHLAFRPSVRLQAKIPAPNTPLQFTARLSQGGVVLRTEEFFVHLNQCCQRVWLERFELLELGAPLQGRHVRLSLSVSLGDQLKVEWPIIILPVERITNFEGQLNRCQQDLPLDEDAYQEILTHLASNQPARSENLRFRRLLRSVGLSSVWPLDPHPLPDSKLSHPPGSIDGKSPASPDGFSPP